MFLVATKQKKTEPQPFWSFQINNLKQQHTQPNSEHMNSNPYFTTQFGEDTNSQQKKVENTQSQGKGQGINTNSNQMDSKSFEEMVFGDSFFREVCMNGESAQKSSGRNDHFASSLSAASSNAGATNKLKGTYQDQSGAYYQMYNNDNIENIPSYPVNAFAWSQSGPGVTNMTGSPAHTPSSMNAQFHAQKFDQQTALNNYMLQAQSQIGHPQSPNASFFPATPTQEPVYSPIPSGNFMESNMFQQQQQMRQKVNPPYFENNGFDFPNYQVQFQMQQGLQQFQPQKPMPPTAIQSNFDSFGFVPAKKMENNSNYFPNTGSNLTTVNNQTSNQSDFFRNLFFQNNLINNNNNNVNPTGLVTFQNLSDGPKFENATATTPTKKIVEPKLSSPSPNPKLPSNEMKQIKNKTQNFGTSSNSIPKAVIAESKPAKQSEPQIMEQTVAKKTFLKQIDTEIAKKTGNNNNFLRAVSDLRDIYLRKIGESETCDEIQEFLHLLDTHLKTKTPLVRLSVCHSCLTDDDVEIILSSVQEVMKTPNFASVSPKDFVQEILFNHNKISDSGASFAVKFIQGNPNISSLELFGNNLSDESCKYIGELLKTNKSLLRLKIGDNFLTCEGIRFLSEGLSLNNTLTQLHIGGNNISWKGIEYLQAASVSNSTLTSLGLRDNKILCKGMEALSKILENPQCKLTDIQLKGNQIRSEGTVHLANTIKKCNKKISLKVLELQTNEIGSEGVKPLCTALEENESIHALNFNGLLVSSIFCFFFLNFDNKPKKIINRQPNSGQRR